MNFSRDIGDSFGLYVLTYFLACFFSDLLAVDLVNLCVFERVLHIERLLLPLLLNRIVHMFKLCWHRRPCLLLVVR